MTKEHLKSMKEKPKRRTEKLGWFVGIAIVTVTCFVVYIVRLQSGLFES